jgi:hypothetical protein
VDDPDGPTETEAILVTGGFIGVAMALLIEAQASGTAEASQRAFGIIVGLALLLAGWWWMRRLR